MRALRFLLAIFIGSTLASAQEPVGQITINVRKVSVNVNVVDVNGRPVTRLVKEDFTISEDGVPQEIQNFDNDEVGYNVLLLVDCSGSTEADRPLMGKAVDRFAAELRTQDTISVALFGSGVETILDWQRRAPASVGLQFRSNSPSCAGTNFYGALEAAIGKFKAIDGRKGVVVLTDGAQTPIAMENKVIAGHSVERVKNSADDREFQKTLSLVSRSDVIFYFLAVNTDLNPDPAGGRSRFSTNGIFNPDLIYNMQQIRSRMQQLAEATGGRVAFPSEPSDVAKLYEDIARELGTNYTLWYAPRSSDQQNETKPRDITVSVKTPGVKLKRDHFTYIPSAP
ncbi:MAG TPA: VWA domain-containing protein [Terriglobia bacterium]|nr:VWA domain-containing protein [Terriglobia bacterium]